MLYFQILKLRGHVGVLWDVGCCSPDRRVKMAGWSPHSARQRREERCCYFPDNYFCQNWNFYFCHNFHNLTIINYFRPERVGGWDQALSSFNVTDSYWLQLSSSLSLFLSMNDLCQRLFWKSSECNEIVAGMTHRNRWLPVFHRHHDYDLLCVYIMEFKFNCFKLFSSTDFVFLIDKFLTNF